MFLSHIPAPPISLVLVVAAFAVASFLVVGLCEWRQGNLVLLFSLLLLLPPVIFVLALLQNYWFSWPILATINTSTICTGGGFVGLYCYCLSRENSNSV